MKNKKELFLPFLLTAAVILADQLTKLWVLKTIEPYTVGKVFFGDLLKIILVYNTGAAFSFGHTLTGFPRLLILCIMPVIFICIFVWIYFKNSFSRFERWTICGIFGGGIGNLIDRFFRPQGVVDFIDVKFFGIFGLERWPTFNLADSAVVICFTLLMIYLIIKSFKTGKNTGKTSGKK